MLSFLAPYRLLIEVLSFCALFGGIALGVHEFLGHEQKIGYDKAVAEYNVKLAEAKDAARKTEQDLNKQLQDAQNAATIRNQRIDASVASVTAANNSLRDALGHIRDGVPSATAASLAQSVTTLTTVLGDCSAKYSGMAEVADRHASDAKKLFDAWPKVK